MKQLVLILLHKTIRVLSASDSGYNRECAV